MAKYVLCRAATPFTPEGALDEAALRRSLERLVAAKMGVYLGNPGAGEGHALTEPELDRLYRVGVEICKGKVPVHANPPEQPTARDAIRHLKIAAAAGVELVNLYGPSGRHGYKPTDLELAAYFDEVLSQVKHSVAIAPDPATGYTAKADIVAQVCEKYPLVRAINVGEPGEDYLLTLEDRLKRDVEICVVSPGALKALDIGAAGALSVEANIIPETCQRYFQAYNAGNSAEAGAAYLQLRRFMQYCSKWGPVHARWLKMCMRVLKLPGGAGSVREPYQLPAAEEIRKFGEGLIKLDIPEISEQARRAGLQAA